VTRVLFVSNGHGEAAIADRVARDVRALLPDARLDHLALVGDSRSERMLEVGPRRCMPSGGLIAMGNVKNVLRDLCAGLLGLVASQRRFLRAARGSYDASVAVGDAYALAMTLQARAPTVFVGTAKSVSVAPYGRFEERVLSRAAVRFVRDEPTAEALRARGLTVEPAANTIVDLFSDDEPNADAAVRDFKPALALLPGSRLSAYADAGFLLTVLRELLPLHASLGAVLSVARGLDPQRFAIDARRAGWDVRDESELVPFSLALQGRVTVRAWSGPLGPIFGRVSLVMGQAGTANEGAAAAGVPVVAFAAEREGASRWYRQRQQGLLGDALAVFPRRVPDAAAALAKLLDDPARRRQMSDAGRMRMGAPGASARIARAVAALASRCACVA